MDRFLKDMKWKVYRVEGPKYKSGKGFLLWHKFDTPVIKYKAIASGIANAYQYCNLPQSFESLHLDLVSI